MQEEEGALGVWLTYLLAGVGGTVASYLTAPHTHTISLGASGAVFGLFMVRRRTWAGRGAGGLHGGGWLGKAGLVRVAVHRRRCLRRCPRRPPPARAAAPLTHPGPQVSLIAKFKPSLKRLLEFVILGQFVVQQVRLLGGSYLDGRKGLLCGSLWQAQRPAGRFPRLAMSFPQPLPVSSPPPAGIGRIPDGG